MKNPMFFEDENGIVYYLKNGFYTPIQFNPNIIGGGGGRRGPRGPQGPAGPSASSPVAEAFKIIFTETEIPGTFNANVTLPDGSIYDEQVTLSEGGFSIILPTEKTLRYAHVHARSSDSGGWDGITGSEGSANGTYNTCTFYTTLQQSAGFDNRCFWMSDQQDPTDTWGGSIVSVTSTQFTIFISRQGSVANLNFQLYIYVSEY